MEQGLNLFSQFTKPLYSIPYAITGSVATIMYGEPRLTHDLDILLKLSESMIEHFISCFSEKHYYVPIPDVLVTEVNRSNRGHFNLIHYDTGFKCDCYLCGQDTLLLWAIQNRISIPISEEQVYFAPIEYVLFQKLRFFKEGGSEKHLRDIAGVLKLKQTNLNLDTLTNLLDEYNLTKLWNKHFGQEKAI